MRTLMMMLATLLMLLGCASPQEKAQNEARKREAEMALMVVEFGPACTQVGFTANTDPWRNCVVQQAATREANKSGWSSLFGSWGRWGRGGSGTAVGAGVGAGR